MRIAAMPVSNDRATAQREHPGGFGENLDYDFGGCLICHRAMSSLIRSEIHMASASD